MRRPIVNIFILLYLVALLPSAFALADSGSGSVTVGNGGKVVACKISDGSIRYEALDIFEWSNHYQFPNFRAGADSYQIARGAVDALDDAQYGFDDPYYASPAAIQPRMDYFAEFLRNAEPGKPAEPTNDVGEVILLPPNCELVQAVNFFDTNKIQINLEIWHQLSPLSQAAFLLHEPVYWYLREPGVERDSKRTRRIVAFLLSGRKVVPTSRLPKGINEVQYCVSKKKDSEHLYPTRLLAYRSGRNETVVQFINVGGYRMLTRTTLTGRVASNGLAMDVDGPELQTITGPLDSVIDKNAQVQLSWGRGRLDVSGFLDIAATKNGNKHIKRFSDQLECQLAPVNR